MERMWQEWDLEVEASDPRETWIPAVGTASRKIGMPVLEK